MKGRWEAGIAPPHAPANPHPPCGAFDVGVPPRGGGRGSLVDLLWGGRGGGGETWIDTADRPGAQHPLRALPPFSHRQP